MAALAATAGLAGCGTRSAGPAPSVSVSQDPNDKSVVWANWTLYLDYNRKRQAYPTLERFEEQTGYAPEEVLGQNCRFLQGPDTDPNAVEAIRAALKARTTFTIDILNYRKSGEPFMNRLRIRPLFDENGELTYYVGVQNPV